MEYQYQTFDDALGLVDSKAKLRALHLPPLVGRTFLDVGCNEGFYCGVALEAGARRVVGLDSFPLAIERARTRFPDAEFLHRSWDELPSEEFDIVLYSSAMHYLGTREKIADLLSSMKACLSPAGLLIIETGVSKAQGLELQPVERPDATVYYPTINLLSELFDAVGLTWRPVGPSITGDGLERTVFHCRVRRTTAVVLRGDPNTGKSYFARALVSGGHARAVSVDLLAQRMYERVFEKEVFDPVTMSGVTEIVRRLGEAGARDLAKEIIAEAKHVGRSSGTDWGDLVVVDGLCSVPEHQVAADVLINSLYADEFVVWEASNRTPFEADYWNVAAGLCDCGGYLRKHNDKAKLKVFNIEARQNAITCRASFVPNVDERPLEALLMSSENWPVDRAKLSSYMLDGEVIWSWTWESGLERLGEANRDHFQDTSPLGLIEADQAWGLIVLSDGSATFIHWRLG